MVVTEINFSKVLTEIMNKYGYTELQLARLIGVKSKQVREWLEERSLPNYHSLKVMCIRLGVKSDYLLGLEGANE